MTDLGLEELSAPEVAEKLGLEPHREGGYFRENYRSPIEVRTEAGTRALSTIILYLLTVEDPSRFHRLRSDELWLYHAGAPTELVRLAKPIVAQRVVGLDCPQALVPANSWMGARVLTEGQADWGAGRAPERRWTPDRRYSPGLRWTLLSCVVTPGFDYHDLEMGDRQALLRDYPAAREIILALT